MQYAKNMQENADIIVSLPTNRGDNKTWNNKVNSVNASMKMEFQDSKRVHISDNSNLYWRGEPNRKMINQIDGVHPTVIGENVLFGNIRQAIDSVLKC